MLTRFFRSEPAAAIVLLLASAVAMVIANTTLYSWYHDTLGYVIGGLAIHEWINDALMAIFFLLVGMEIKKEMVSGSLSRWGDRIVPGLAALGGMATPALIFLFINRAHADHHVGWAIPTATDIAFSMGVLALLGSRVPASIRILLVSIAVLDDLGAIVVIAVFYSGGTSWAWLGASAICIAALLVLNKRSVYVIWPYLLIGVGLWIAIFNSGLHATLSGVIVAMCLPSRSSSADNPAPLGILEHRIQNWVNFGIIPLFGFANAGVHLGGVQMSNLADTLPLGVVLGLFLGKQIGIFSTVWLMVKVGIARMPQHATWVQLHAMAVLCGIGFTMSIFIAGLAFAETPEYLDMAKIGIISGSLISAIVGTLLMRRATAVTD